MAKCKIDEQGRECRLCRTYKPWDAFYTVKSGPRGKDSACRECKAAVRAANSTAKSVMEGFDPHKQQFILGTNI